MDWFNPFENSEGGGGGGSGTDNYNELLNKPSINNTTLSGNKNSDDLGLQAKIDSNHKLSSDNVNDSGAQNLFTNATEKQTWNAKQDAIQNLQDIQNGAALGATSLQPSDVKSTYNSSGTDPVNGKAVAAAIGTLDVAAVGGSGSFISGISETNGKISATTGTFDSTPTQNSTNPVTSAGIYTDQVRQDTLEAQDRAALIEVENKGAKNLLKFRDGVSSASAGNVYANINADGTLSVGLTSGTTATAQLVFTLGAITKYRDKKLVLSGCPAGGNYQSGYALYIANDGATAQADTGSGAILPIVTGLTSSVVALIVRSGTTISSELTFQPMICSKAEWDISNAFVPYGKTNAELTLLEKQDRDGLATAIDKGAKNLFDMSGAQTFDVTGYGVHCTINKLTGVITLDGVNQDKKCTGSFNIKIADSTALGLQSGVVYKLNCDGYTTSDTTIGIYVYTSGATPETQFDTYSHTELAWNTAWEQSNGFRLFIRSGTVVNNITLRPMLCTKSEWDISQAYVPYGKTNAELTAEKTDMIDVYGRGIEIPENADLHTYTTPGVYFSVNSARTATLSNVPTDIAAGFRLVVTEEISVDSSRIRHDLYPIGAAYSSFYSENLGPTSTTYPDGWRPWVTYGPITTNPDSATLMNYMAPSAKKFYDDQQRQETEIGVVANAGAKNFASKNSGSGTNSTAIPKTPITLPVGDYICSFSASSYSGNAAFELWNASNSQQYVKELTVAGSNSFKFTVTGAMSVAKYSLYVNNATISDFMIRPSAITDTSYQPYARPNPALTAEMDYVVNAGAKNLLKIDKSQIKSSSWNTDWTWSGDTASNGNASITINQDNTFTVAVSNTMAAQVIFDIYLSNVDVSNAILSGCPSGGSSSTHFMYVKGTSYYDTGNGVTFSKTGPFRIAIVVASGHAAGTYIFKPMIRPAAITDPTFQPYARPNPTLTAEMDYVVNAGAKNLLPMTHAGGSITRYGVTCTWDLNAGTMTLNGTHIIGDNASIFEFYDGSAEATKMLPAGSYVLTGCPAGGSTSTYRAVLSQIAGAVDVGNGATFELSEPHYAAYRILISGNVTFNNMVFKPMIRPAAITDPTFQPCARTNRELTVLTDEDRAALVEIVDSGAKNLSQFNSGTAAYDNVALATGIPLLGHAGEVLVISYETALSSGISTIGFKDANGTSTGSVEIGNVTKQKIVTIPEGTAKFNVFVSKAGTYANFMICTKAAWDISHAYQPYRPSYQELYEIVLALQSGGNRALTMQTEPEEQEER